MDPSDERERLEQLLLDHYRNQGWRVRADAEGVLRADGPGGVTWIGLVATLDDVRATTFGERVARLSAERMPGGGSLCPLDILAAPDAEREVDEVIRRTGLKDRRPISVYSLVT